MTSPGNLYLWSCLAASSGGALTLPNFHVILFLHKQTPNLNVLNLTFQIRNPTFSSHGKSLTPLQCSWKRRVMACDSDIQKHKYNRPLFLQSYSCGLQTVFLDLRFAFFSHGVSHFFPPAHQELLSPLLSTGHDLSRCNSQSEMCH